MKQGITKSSIRTVWYRSSLAVGRLDGFLNSGLHFLKRDGVVVRLLDTDVDVGPYYKLPVFVKPEHRVIAHFVCMAVDVRSLTVDAPWMHGDVRKQQPVEYCAGTDLLEAGLYIGLDGEVIVVPQDEPLVPIQATAQLDEVSAVGAAAEHRHITQMPHVVLRLDKGVPVRDETLVHLLRVGEGTLAELDDIVMPEVRVRGIPDLH